MLPAELFRPKSVAVVGASRNPEKAGHGVLRNLLRAGFPGEIYAVNPRGGEVLGQPLYAGIDEIPGSVDLGVFAVPPAAIPEGIRRLARRGMKAAIVISAGFREAGGEGVRHEQALREAAAETGVRVLGPNCLGLIDTQARLNASFSAGTPPAGAISFFSQSGALCTAILDWALGENVGFSKFISLGNKADVDESDVIEYLADDPDTRVILGYVESIDDGVRFLRASRAVTAKKPVIVVKAGTTASGARAASSHTGSLAGSDKAYSAAFRQGGILRAHTVEDLFDLALGFAMQPLPESDRLLIVTNAGGPGILAADAAERAGIPLAEISPALRERLGPLLPPTTGPGNPLDLVGDARADRYRAVFSAVRQDPSIGSVLVLLTPQAMTEPEETARAAVEELVGRGSTVFASFLGEISVQGARDILSAGGIPNYPAPERAVGTIHAMLRYRRLRAGATAGPAAPGGPRPAAAADAVRGALEAGKRALGEEDSRAILEAYGFVFPKHVFVRTSREAARAFPAMGGPVAMKIVSPDVLHKTDVGGVRLNVATAKEAAKAFVEITSSVRRRAPAAWIGGVSLQEMVHGGRELILGMTRDRQFGPLILFGLGGIHVEILGDVSYRVAPISEADAREMVREIRAYPLLAGYRGSDPVDEDAVVEALLRISRLSLEFPEIQELDINPVVALPKGGGVRAIDCRMAIAEAGP